MLPEKSFGKRLQKYSCSDSHLARNVFSLEIRVKVHIYFHRLFTGIKSKRGSYFLFFIFISFIKKTCFGTGKVTGKQSVV